MYCPFCNSTQVAVVNSRATKKDSQIWRRRKCLICNEVFTTYEKIDLSHLIIIKKSGRKERFIRAKLYAGIYGSTIDKKNADKGEMSELAEEVTNKVEQDIVALKRKKIQSVEITEMVLKILGKRAPDALLRFLAYREGENKKRL